VALALFEIMNATAPGFLLGLDQLLKGCMHCRDASEANAQKY